MMNYRAKGGLPTAEEERNAFVDAAHQLLPMTREGETATQFRARCQIEIGEALYRSALLKRMLEP